MPICPDCRPFAPKDTDTEPDSDLSYDKETQSVSGTVRIHNDCENCGQELEETEFTFDIDCREAIDAHKKAGKKSTAHSFDEDSITVERTDDVQRVDRRGKPIKNPRYWSRLYGVTVVVQLQCSCGEDIDEVTAHEQTKASYMDSLV
jgi:hypothetical protein